MVADNGAGIDGVDDRLLGPFETGIAEGFIMIFRG